MRLWLVFLSLLLFVPTAPADDYRDFPTLEFDGIRFRFPHSGRIVAIGDTHADADAVLRICESVGLIRFLTPQEWIWIGGDTQVVFLGDMVHRGPNARFLLEFLFELELKARAAGGKIHRLMGNHEQLALEGLVLDMKHGSKPYLWPSDCRLWFEFGEFPVWTDRDNQSFRTIGYHRALTDWNSPFAKDLRNRNTLLVIGDNLFVHGGITRYLLNAPKDHIGRVNASMRAFVRHFQSIYSMSRGIKREFASPEERSLQDKEDLAYDDHSTIWNWITDGRRERDSPIWTDQLTEKLLTKGVLQRILGQQELARVIVAHSMMPYREPARFYDGLVWDIDTGISRNYRRGSLYALEIFPDAEPQVLGPFPRARYAYPIVHSAERRYRGSRITNPPCWRTVLAETEFD